MSPLRWFLGTLLELALLVGLMAAWSAPRIDTWGFWGGITCIAFLCSFNEMKGKRGD